eukprot:6181853-Pleurochrysis_carterae.AAC.1
MCALCRLRTRWLQVGFVLCPLLVPFALLRWTCGPRVSRALHVLAVLRLLRQSGVSNMRCCETACAVFISSTRRLRVVRLKSGSSSFSCIFCSALCLLFIPFSIRLWTRGPCRDKDLQLSLSLAGSIQHY